MSFNMHDASSTSLSAFRSLPKQHPKIVTSFSVIVTVSALTLYVCLVRGAFARFLSGEYSTNREIEPRRNSHAYVPSKMSFTLRRDHVEVLNESLYHVELSARTYPCCDSDGKLLGKEKVPVQIDQCDNAVAETSNCLNPDKLNADFKLRGEYGSSPDYSFLQFAVLQCDPTRGARQPVGAPCATERDQEEFWNRDLEMELCIQDTLSAVAESVWRCPLWVPIPGPTWMLRIEVYLQLHITKLESQWDLFHFGWGSSEKSYLSFSRSVIKTKNQAHRLAAGERKDLDLVKIYVRLDDLVITETMTQITILDVLSTTGASWIMMLLFTLVFRKIFQNIYRAYLKKNKESDNVSTSKLPRAIDTLRVDHDYQVSRVDQLEKEISSLLRDRRPSTSERSKALSFISGPGTDLPFRPSTVERGISFGSAPERDTPLSPSMGEKSKVSFDCGPGTDIALVPPSQTCMMVEITQSATITQARQRIAIDL